MDELLLQCIIRKENNNNWLFIGYNPSQNITGDSYLLDFFTEEELLNKVYENVKEQIHFWYINNK